MSSSTGGLQRLGKALMMPISIIAAAGIFLGIAAALQNPGIVGESFVNATWVQYFIGFVRKIAGTLFGNLPVLFAVAVAVGMADDEKPTAAFASVIGFLMMHVAINYVLGMQGITPESISVKALLQQGMSVEQATMVNSQYGYELGIFTYRMNVFGAIVSSLLVAWLHNRFYTIKLPDAINFFGGRRFVPIVTVVALPVLGLVMTTVWPYVSEAIQGLGRAIQSSGSIGSFLFGFSERLLIPTGLHHILNQTVRFTPVGGSILVDGQQIVGALSIFNEALANPGAVAQEAVREATRFLAQGKIPVMVFGLPAAALAIYHTASDKDKARVKALMLAGAVTSIVTGITEPLEFSFMFVSPILFLIHSLMTGISFMIMDLMQVIIGNVQGGLIDLVVFGVLNGSDTHWYYTVLLGLIYVPVYYFSFRFLIQKLDLKTPGREGYETSAPAAQNTDASTDTLGATIIQGLGGKANIKSVDNCITRLRVVVTDDSLIDEALLMTTGCAGLIKVGGGNIQVVYGPRVEQVTGAVKMVMATA